MEAIRFSGRPKFDFKNAHGYKPRKIHFYIQFKKCQVKYIVVLSRIMQQKVCSFYFEVKFC